MSADTGAREPQRDSVANSANYAEIRARAEQLTRSIWGEPTRAEQAGLDVLTLLDALAAGVGVPPDRRRIETTQFRIGNAHIELPGEHVAFADRVIRMHAALEAIASISEDAIVDDDGRSPLSRIYALADEGLYGSVDT